MNYIDSKVNISRQIETNTLKDFYRKKQAKDDKKLREASEEFEAILVKTMLKESLKKLGKSDLLYGGMAEDIFRDMLWDEYTKILAKSHQLNLSKEIYDQLTATRKSHKK